MDAARISAEISAAQALAAAGNVRGALDRLRQLNSDGGFGDPLVLTMCAIYERRLGDPKTAHRALRAALEIDPEFALAHRIMGLVLIELNSAGAAEGSFREAIRLEPDQAYHYLPLGELLAGLGRRREAEETLTQALSLAPDDPNMLAALGLLLTKQRRFDEAAPLIDKALTGAPDNPDILSAAGLIAIDQHRDDDARAYAMAALQINSVHEGALDLLVQLKAKRGLFMRVWWRWNAMLGRMSLYARGALIIGLLFGAQVFFRAGRAVLPAPLLIALLVVWIGFVVLTWVGPYIYERMLKKEMEKVRLRPDF